MTWRKFTTLLRGLGPNAASVTRAQYRRAQERSKGKVTSVTTPEAAQRVFESLFRPPEKKQGNRKVN